MTRMRRWRGPISFTAAYWSRPRASAMRTGSRANRSLFRAAAFGDDTDRPLRKSDGTWTYFATDIAYHRDKIERGFTDLIDVWGADHGGYVKRMKAAVSALSGDSASLDVKICQMVKLLDGGEPVAMSKRSGRFVTLRDVVDEVGRDVVRFIMLTRRNDAPLEFDLNRVTEQSRDNPVFYVQYAHARACSALRRGAEIVPEPELAPAALARVDLACLGDPSELDLDPPALPMATGAGGRGAHPRAAPDRLLFA